MIFWIELFFLIALTMVALTVGFCAGCPNSPFRVTICFPLLSGCSNSPFRVTIAWCFPLLSGCPTFVFGLGAAKYGFSNKTLKSLVNIGKGSKARFFLQFPTEGFFKGRESNSIEV